MKSSHQQNIRLVIFDFDGTIADTSDGILDSHSFTLKSMGYPIPEDIELKKVIGGNLLRIYEEGFGFDEKSAKQAVKLYRQRYKEEGVHRAKLYEGVEKLLVWLKKNDKKTAIATLKADKFAKQMAEELGISKYFDCIYGMNSDDSLRKSDLITMCINNVGCIQEETMFIGDSQNDLRGAQESNVSFIGVTYGFGFSHKVTYDFTTVNTPIDLIKKLDHEHR